MRAIYCILVILFFGSLSLSANGQTIPTSHAREKRILVVGDSLTSGLYTTSESKAFKRILEQRTGYTLGSQGVGNLSGASKTLIYEKWPADIIVLEIGLNDVRLAEPNWASRYGELLDRLMGTGAIIVVCTMFHAQPVTHPRYQIYEAYNEIIIAESEKRGILVADLWNATKECPKCISRDYEASPFAPGYAGDNFHPSDLGHYMIADEIMRVLGMDRNSFFPIVRNQ